MKDLLEWKNNQKIKKSKVKMTADQMEAHVLKYGEGDELRKLESSSKSKKVYYKSGADKLAPMWRRRSEVFMAKIVENNGGYGPNQCVSNSRNDFVERAASRAIEKLSVTT